MTSDLPPVLDPASGSRMFYFDKQDERSRAVVHWIMAVHWIE